MVHEILNQCLSICGSELFTESCSYYNLVPVYSDGILMYGEDGILMMSHIHNAVFYNNEILDTNYNWSQLSFL